MCRGGGIGWLIKALFQQGIARIAVPFFFMTAGFFLAKHMDEPGWWPRELRKRVRTLLIPFFLWNLIWLVYATPLTILANWRSGVPLLLGLPHGIGGMLGLFGCSPFSGPFLGVLWFVRFLFILIVISPILCAVVERGRSWAWGIVVLCGIGYLVTRLVDLSTPWEKFWDFGFSPIGVLFFMLGLIFRRYPVEDPLPTWLAPIGLMLTFGAILFEKGAQTHCTWGATYAAYAALPLIMLGIWSVWRLMPAGHWPVWLTSCSFVIYVTHPFVMKFWLGVSNQFAWVSALAGTVWGHLLFWATGVFFGVVLAAFARRFCPRFAALLFGGR